MQPVPGDCGKYNLPEGAMDAARAKLLDHTGRDDNESDCDCVLWDEIDECSDEDEGILCDRCDRPFHLSCLADMGVDCEAAKDAIETMADWLCFDWDLYME